MVSHWRWWEVACANARMWLAAKQPLRAAHVAKLCLRQFPENGDGVAWALEVAAEAYYQHWKQTGPIHTSGWFAQMYIEGDAYWGLLHGLSSKGISIVKGPWTSLL